MTVRLKNAELEFTRNYFYLRLGRLELYAGRDAGFAPAPATRSR